ncbi:MAG: hypothetical protein EBS07_04125 [Sphingobacteriia bacterium]|nr:hypothetical protein [Sphingobacteriia bacterium]
MKNIPFKLINFSIDTLVFFGSWFLVLYLFNTWIPQENVKWYTMILYFVYYFLFESFVLKTPGKWITKSKISNSSTLPIPFILAVFIRSIIRLLPLDILSYLFYPIGLHEKLSGLYTIQE